MAASRVNPIALLSAQTVFHSTNSILYLACCLLGFAFGLGFGVSGNLPSDLLDATF
jgi:hypothetical protein